MTILHVLDLGEIGGLMRVVHALAAGHSARGHDVHVAAVMHADRSDHPLLIRLRDANVRVSPVIVPPRGYRAERRRFAALCHALRPDVVHTHGYRPDLVDAGVARRLGIPVVTTVHGFTGGGWRNRLNEWLQRRAIRRFDAVVAVSAAMAERLVREGAPADRVIALRNAWAPATSPLQREAARLALDLPPDRFHVGWVGRLSREKGPDVLVDALARLADLPLTASFLGDGPERRRLEDHTARLALHDRVRWHGTIDDAARVLPAFDVFVLSSRAEGTPIALFEAIAAGVPVVATRVGGVPEVLSHGEAALVPPDDPLRLADAIRAVARTPETAAARARAARRRLDHEFALGPWLERYEALYRSLRRPAPGREAP
ncbi:MAG TPA: glycosyltransferase [Longimicrobiales bacterium]